MCDFLYFLSKLSPFNPVPEPRSRIFLGKCFSEIVDQVIFLKLILEALNVCRKNVLIY